MTILESVALGKDRSNRKMERKVPSKNDGRIADKGLKICPECNAVWEGVHWRSEYLIEYYHEIPRYGKKEKSCPKCVDK